jgi:SAM-dependent methyltransferase
MSSTAAVPGSTIVMRGAGYYSANTVGAKTVIDKAGDLVAAAIAETAIETERHPFAIADYGAADGGTSLDMMRRVIALVRGRAPDRPITLTYTDLPHNDFSALFRLTQGQLGEPTAEPIAAIPGLFIWGCGTTFYKQLFPDETIDLGFSATAMHWLSRKPGPIADHVHAVGAAKDEQETFRHQAALDWNTILLNRARELKPGGALVLANFCIDDRGQYLGHTGGVDMFDTFTELWRDLWKSGGITEAEFRNATFQQFYRTPEEYAAPFRDPDSPVLRAGLRLDHVSTTTTPCPFAAAFARDGDARGFARAFVPTLRSWSEVVFANALDATRPAAERIAIIDAFYESYEDAVARSPVGHGMDYVHCFMKIRKI